MSQNNAATSASFYESTEVGENTKSLKSPANATYKPGNLHKPGKATEQNTAPVAGEEAMRAKKQSELLEALGTARVEGNAYSVDKTARKEWVTDSGILEHLYELNTVVGKSADCIAADTNFPVLGVSATKRDKKGSTVKATGLDISKGWWKIKGYNWLKDADRREQAQYKTLSDKSTGKDGKPVKYVSKVGSKSEAYTLRVTEAEIEAAIARWGVAFPYEKELVASPDAVSHYYWKWALGSKDVPVVVTEGAKKAASLIGQGIPAIALPGVSNIWNKKGSVKTLTRDLQYLRAPGKPVYLAFDSDIQEKDEVQAALRKLCTELEKPLSKKSAGPDIKVMVWTVPEGKGVDDLFVKHGANFVWQLVQSAMSFEEWQQETIVGDWYPDTLKKVLEKKHQLYFMTIGNNESLYKYDRTAGVYCPCTTAVKMVAEVLDQTPGPDADDEKGKEGSSAGHPDIVAKMMKAIRQYRVIEPDNVNPPRHWCTANGVLSLQTTRSASGYTATPVLTPHQPYTGGNEQIAFTDRAEWCYDVNADRTELTRQLQFVPDNYRDTLMDLLACSLDMPSARAILLREYLPGLFLKGEGQNGKDSLRNLLELLHQGNKTNVGLASISDHDHDTNKFAINGLRETTCVNFSSENKKTDISKLETLKALVTGDPVRIADKGINARSIKVSALQIFCTNRDMVISDTSASITSRYKVMTLPYSFQSEEDYAKKSEEEKRDKYRLADVRFGDRAWVSEHVMPALFNELVERLVATLNRRKIDWSACEHEFANLAAESDHVKGFLASDFINVTGRPDDFASTDDIYKAYCKYCVDIERAILETDSSFKSCLVEVDYKSPQAKYDPLCANAVSLGKKVATMLRQKAVRKSVKKKQCRGFVGVVA